MLLQIGHGPCPGLGQQVVAHPENNPSAKYKIAIVMRIMKISDISNWFILDILSLLPRWVLYGSDHDKFYK